MNVNSTSTYTYGSSASKGLSGLASGLDTESLVKEMLSGTQGKIDKQEGLKQQTEWKQEIYRDLISQINSFQTGYFSSGSSTSLTSSALYNAMVATASSKNINVTASSSAPVGNTSVTVYQLASNYSISSAAKVSGRMAGTLNLEQLQTLIDEQREGDRVLAFNVGAAKGGTDSSVVKIDLKDFFVSGNSFRTEIDENGIAAEIQKQLMDQAGLDAKVTISGGQLSIVSKDGDRSLNVSSESSDMALSALGLTTSSSAKLNLGKTQRTLTSAVNLTPSLRFNMTLDDSLQKEITLDVRALMDGTGRLTAQSVTDALQNELNKKFGSGVVTVTNSGNGIELSTAVAGRKLVVNTNSSDRATLGALGLKNGQSNRIAAYNTLGELQSSTPLQGKRFEFEINGAKFSFTEDDDIDYVMSKINNSTAGVTVVYKPLEDTFVMMANDAGAGRTIEMSQTQGNLLNVMFGLGDGNLKTGGTVASAPLTGEKLTGGDTYLEGIRSGLFSLTVNGKEYNLELSKRDTAYEADEIIDKLNSELRRQFGVSDELAEDGSDIQNIELVKEGTGYALVVRNGAAVELAGVSVDSDDAEGLAQLVQDRGNLAVALGLVSDKNGKTNVFSETTKLSETEWGSDLATILGIDPDTTLADLARASKNSATNLSGVIVSFEDGRLVVTAEDGAPVPEFKFGTEDQMKQLFGVSALSLNAADANSKAGIVIEGRNAIVNIDGMLTERNSNVFTYNGMTVELNSVSKTTGETMKGKLMVDDGSGGTKEWESFNGRWVDAEGYERAEDGQYVAVSASGKDMRVKSADDLPAGYSLKQYTGMAFFTEDGQQISGVGGIGADGSLLDANGKALEAREAEKITVTRDTDKIVDTVKNFIDEYNKLVKTISDLLNEDASYRDYAPLTDEQRAEMSDKQIELWEEKAKEGLLRRDSILTQFLQDMRSIWYETNSSGYAIYQFGIETGEWSSRGQLAFTSDGEATLRAMLASDPTGVMNFFANSVDGAAVRVNEVIRAVANTSSGSPGTLVQLAGIKGMASETNNTLYEQLRKIDEQIERLKNQYEQEKDRYWKQFNSMEQAIADMNSQSAYLAQMFTY
ncbi:MAG: flagellar filament capping protein FliD [Subdoligranulum sp.]|nr:flagellar filament capping protein FliD [Subdoligranulum sp.]